jgi:hypothetical protein
MSKERELEKLTTVFRKLGAKDPERWARSQVEEGIPQLARFVFLKQAWKSVVSEDDSSWIDGQIMQAASKPDEPYAGVGQALLSLRALGASDEELTDLVRGMQAELLFQICSLLGDPGDLEPAVKDLGWVLVQIDEEGNPVDAIGGLHESVLELDPTGREMRPRPASDMKS